MLRPYPRGCVRSIPLYDKAMGPGAGPYPQEPPRGKNVQVYDYLGKGQKAHYGGKKDEREAIFLSLVLTWSSGQHVRFWCKRFEVRGIASVSFFSCRLALHMVPNLAHGSSGWLVLRWTS